MAIEKDDHRVRITADFSCGHSNPLATHHRLLAPQREPAAPRAMHHRPTNQDELPIATAADSCFFSLGSLIISGTRYVVELYSSVLLIRVDDEH